MPVKCHSGEWVNGVSFQDEEHPEAMLWCGRKIVSLWSHAVKRGGGPNVFSLLDPDGWCYLANVGWHRANVGRSQREML